MKVRYEHGGDHDPVKDVLSSQVFMLPTAEVATDFVPRDEDEAKIYRNLGVQGVMDLRDMKGAVREGRGKFAENYMLPALELALAVESGKGALDLGRLGVQGIRQLIKKSPGILKRLMKSGTKAVDDAAKKAGFDPTDIAALRKDGVPEEEIMKLVKGPQTKMTKKTADNTQAYIERMKRQKVQNQANRALRQAAREESQARLNLQGRLSELGMEAKEAEKLAEKIFRENVDDIFTQARIDDVVLGKGDQLAKKLGPTMQELYNTNRGVFNAVYNELIKPVTSKKISGAVNPRMNQFGGKINVRKA
tara:strand:+ start:11127 stop:12044 length:918 start_codon:yes stop_codon:yes gene_type:complete